MKLKISALTIILIIVSLIFIYFTLEIHDNYKRSVINCDEERENQLAPSVELNDVWNIGIRDDNTLNRAICFAFEQDSFNKYWNMRFLTLITILLTALSWKMDIQKKV